MQNATVCPVSLFSRDFIKIRILLIFYQVRKETSTEIENWYAFGKHKIFDSVIQNVIP